MQRAGALPKATFRFAATMASIVALTVMTAVSADPPGTKDQRVTINEPSAKEVERRSFQMAEVIRSAISSGSRLHPWPVRIMHWTNAVAMIVMITSGWGIYDDSVIIHGMHFPPSMRLGSWAAQSLLYHFAGMWLLMLNGLAYLVYGLVTGRFRQRLLPIRFGELLTTVRETLHLHIAHDDLTVYNAVQKLLYIVVILAGISQVVTGFAVWKPVQLSWLVALLGGFQGARLVHFLGMGVIVGFLVVHVVLALLVPRTLWAMLAGGPRTENETVERPGMMKGAVR